VRVVLDLQKGLNQYRGDLRRENATARAQMIRRGKAWAGRPNSSETLLRGSHDRE
jgi:hypothetical protein